MKPPPAAGPGQGLRDALRLFWLPLTALALGWLVSLTPMAARWSDSVDDALLRATAADARFDAVAVIDFDDAALVELRPTFGAWPYPRDVHALLLGFLRDAGVRLAVFDIVFGEPRDGDAAFAETIGRRADVVLGAAAMTDRLEQQAPPDVLFRFSTAAAAGDENLLRWPGLKLPIPALREQLGGFGSIGIITTPLDADGHLRRLPMRHQIDDRIYPSLPLAAMLTDSGGDPAALEVRNGRISLGQHDWPVDAAGQVQLALPANAKQLPTLGAGAVLAAALGAIDPEPVARQLRGRTVFIGSSAFLGDRVVTTQGQLTGVAVLAITYDALRSGELIRSAPWYAALALLLAATLPGLLVVRRGRPDVLRDAPIAVLVAGLVGAAAAVMLVGQREQFSPLPAWTIIAIGFVLTALQQLRATSRANRELREQRLAAEAANAAKSEFLAGVSHELRTPLHAVLGMADVLSQTRLDDEQQRYVEVFRKAGTSLASLIDDLLDLSRIEAAQVVLDRQPVSLPDLLQALRALMEPRANAKGLRLEVQLDPSAGPVVEGDAKRLMQVLLNLVGNAIKFTSEGTVSIAVARQADGLLHVQVRDSGIGIAASKLELIFEPFTQADGSVTRTYGGTGLGLSISRQLVDMMGGRVWVDSQPGVGSTFHFTADLPDVLPAATAPAGQPETAPADTGSEGVRILLVEDNEVNVIVVEAMLKDSGHELDIAPNGETAVEMFRAAQYGLVLMDVHMPGMNGYEATREIRSIEAATGREPTAVLALSASAFESDRQASVAAGCNGHLAKPLSRQHLLDAVQTHGRPGKAGVDRGNAADDVIDHQAALRQAGGDEARRQRNLDHAKVFLAGWQPLFQAARVASNRPLQLALCRDLQAVAAGAGAVAVAAAAQRLADLLAADGPVDPAQAIGELMQHLQRAVAAITVSRD
ncbi:ATP-binding protein [Piscinibacter sakaiensis]|uniref:hybrid sensor histidine kinase/response regulator n=1 Tax=Piscinibacter sakaiensis TaxID=1547922 RepID=UPI003AADF69D